MSRAIPIVLVLTAGVLWACQREEGAETAGTETMAPAPAETTVTPAPGSAEAKIASAESAATAEIAQNATIMEMPAEEGGEPIQLRAGTNGWTCIAGESPMCLDGEWLSFAQAWMGKTQPNVTAVGIGYMLQGDTGASNIDPHATEETPDNQWVVSGPHLMVITPNQAQLAALPTDPSGGGPFVMWKDTPYAHIMVPVESPSVR